MKAIKTRSLAAIVGLVAVLFSVGNDVAAATLYVSQASPNPAPPYATWETAARSIQEAVDAASVGDTVLVAAGEYALTNQVTITKGILLRSDAGPSQTILNGQDRVRCLWVSNFVAVVDGFTMYAGGADESGGGGIFLVGATVQNCVIDACNSLRATVAGGAVMIGGMFSNSIVTRVGRGLNARSAVDCGSGGLITDCQITGNGSPIGGLYTGAVYLTDSELRNSVIATNFAVTGGDIYALSSRIVGCTMRNDWAVGGEGSGAYLDRCEVDRCIIVGNRNPGFNYPPGRGGGVFATDSVIRNSLIAGNRAASGDGGASPGFGGGVYLRGGSLLNCTVTGNQANSAGDIYVESGNVRNSIIYFNSASSNANWFWNDPLQLQLGGEAPFAYCCTTPDPGGVGNIVADPQFVNQTNGNYRLGPTSPCTDAGLNEEWMLGATDLDGNPRIDNGIVDPGAWETKTAVNTAPVARIKIEGYPTIITLDASSGTVMLDGSQSSDVDNDPLTYTWSVGDPAEVFASGVRVTNGFATGSYVFHLQVSDGKLTGYEHASLTVLTRRDAIALLIQRIEESSHPNGIKRALSDSLKTSRERFDKGKAEKGIEALKVFQDEVAVKLGQFDPAFAEVLTNAVQKLIVASRQSNQVLGQSRGWKKGNR